MKYLSGQFNSPSISTSAILETVPYDYHTVTKIIGYKWSIEGKHIVTLKEKYNTLITQYLLNRTLIRDVLENVLQHHSNLVRDSAVRS